MKHYFLNFNILSSFVLLSLGSCVKEEFVSVPPSTAFIEKSYHHKAKIEEGRYTAPNKSFSFCLPSFSEKNWQVEEFFFEGAVPSVIFSDLKGDIIRIEILNEGLEENLEELALNNHLFYPIYYTIYEEFIRSHCKEIKTIYWEDLYCNHKPLFFVVLSSPNLSVLKNDLSSIPKIHYRGTLFSIFKGKLISISTQNITKNEALTQEEIQIEINLLKEKLLKILGTFQ